MDIIVDIIQRNHYKTPCRCPEWEKMREPGPYYNHPQSPYYLRCPGGPCKFLPKPKEYKPRGTDNEQSNA